MSEYHTSQPSQSEKERRREEAAKRKRTQDLERLNRACNRACDSFRQLLARIAREEPHKYLDAAPFSDLQLRLERIDKGLRSCSDERGYHAVVSAL